MACFSPITAWQLDSGEIVFAERGKIRRSLTLPCGQCVGCRLERSRQWAVRCVHESQLYDVSSYVTLTYNDEHLPDLGGLEYRHFQLFMKKLRRKFGPVRFFMCGEYGEESKRPHFHACLFGVSFPDREPCSGDGDGFPLYRSDMLESLWGYGFCTIGAVTFDSAAYVARYVMKKVTGDAAQHHYLRTDFRTGEIGLVRPEFCRMSLKPGIGARWIERYSAEVYVRDGCVINGVVVKPPRYYDKWLKEHDGFKSDEVLDARLAKVNYADVTPERLKVREVVTLAKLSVKRRSL